MEYLQVHLVASQIVQRCVMTQSKNQYSHQSLMQVTLYALQLALSCTAINDCFPASCCGMLKDSSSSPKGI